MRLVLEYIVEHLGQDLHGNGIAAVAGLTRYHFGKAFRQTSGMTCMAMFWPAGRSAHRSCWRSRTLHWRQYPRPRDFRVRAILRAFFLHRMGITPGAYRDARRPTKPSLRTI